MIHWAPGNTGLPVAKSRLPKTVFVIISGNNDFEYIRKAIRLIVFDYLDKPITIEKVTEILGEAWVSTSESLAGKLKFYLGM